MKLLSILQALRPKQWIKNGLVPAAWFFALWDPSQRPHAEGWIPFLTECAAAAVFCLAAGSVYLLNDVRDRDADAHHPRKRLRPIAAGKVTPAEAIVTAAILGAAALGSAFVLGRSFGIVVLAYLCLQLVYSFGLKRVAYLDVFVVALGFVLRAMAGALVIDVRISPWLLLCVFLLALFLALCKRRQEKVSLDSVSASHREALASYHPAVLDLQIGVSAACVIVCYAVYTLSADTVARFGNDRLGLTIPFVIFGLFRYLHLVYDRDEGGAPETVLLTDKGIIFTVAGYIFTVGVLMLK